MIESDDDRRRFYEGISFLPDSLISQWTGLLRTVGRTDETDGYATEIIRDFCLRNSLREPQSQVTLDWLADVLDSATEHRNGAVLLQELGLKPRQRRRPADDQLATHVGWWLACAERRGFSPAGAVELAAECFHRDIKSIERYRRKAHAWGSGLAASDETWERYFLNLNPPRPLPPSQNKKS